MAAAAYAADKATNFVSALEMVKDVLRKQGGFRLLGSSRSLGSLARSLAISVDRSSARLPAHWMEVIS